MNFLFNNNFCETIDKKILIIFPDYVAFRGILFIKTSNLEASKINFRQKIPRNIFAFSAFSRCRGLPVCERVIFIHFDIYISYHD